MNQHESQEGLPDPDQPGWQFAVSSGILGWVLDAFDFFVMVFLFDILAAHFHVQKTAIIATLPLTLAMRPVGAFLFGALADRFGRKIPLVVCVLYFSLATVLSGLAPTFGFFVVMRALYGIGMGGYWGIGASYAMESSPRRFRGVLSGMMQAGYPMGYLLAAVVMQLVVPSWGWHAVFYVGAPMALLVVLLTLFAPESKAWRQHRPASVGRMFSAMYQHAGIFFYLLLLMAVMLCLSHGTQDLYPDFLKTIPGIAAKTVLGMKSLYGIPILYNICAILGALVFGQISQSIGRRKAILLALAVSVLSIPAFAFGTTLVVLVAGSCLMQTGVQGAWGVVPAHLNELSPDAVRSLFPGFAYQAGVLLSSPAVLIETALKDRVGYPWALSVFEVCVLAAIVLIIWLGPEAHGRSFLRGGAEQAQAGDLCMTAEDPARWDIGFMEPALPQPASYAEMAPEVKLKSGAGTHYGFGVDVLGTAGADGKQHRLIEPSGEVSGFRSENMVFTEDKVAVPSPPTGRRTASWSSI